MSDPRPIPASRERDAARAEALFRDAGAFRDGHFLLKSGRHADRYLEKFQVLQHPPAVVELCGMIAARARGADGQPVVDAVIGPTTGGVLLAFEVGRQLGVRGFFAEEVKEADGRARRELRRGFRIAPGERILLVDDILTTGGSLLAMLPVVEEAGGELVRAVVIADRSGGLTEVVSPGTGRRYPAEALWTLDVPTWEAGAATCPACAAGIPLDAPGSTGTTRG